MQDGGKAKDFLLFSFRKSYSSLLPKSVTHSKEIYHLSEWIFCVLGKNHPALEKKLRGECWRMHEWPWLFLGAVKGNEKGIKSTISIHWYG